MRGCIGRDLSGRRAPFYARSVPKLNLTISDELLTHIDAERADTKGAPPTRAAFVRRIVEHALNELRRDRWEREEETAYLEQPDEENDPHEFVTWPNYPHDDYTETLIARIKSF